LTADYSASNFTKQTVNGNETPNTFQAYLINKLLTDLYSYKSVIILTYCCLQTIHTACQCDGLRIPF